ncbi:unnamed protein product [Phytophthora lilii]|uniref:Unnamed protein product n=1 Tax=Phytophthora lilii TaxID=2077276 RepID=A0A9W6TQF7_9STRA|nr:unnamed protein product [Phytophthora lilii]
MKRAKISLSIKSEKVHETMEALTHAEDFADAVASIRRYWGADHEHSDAELFAVALQQWENARSGNNAVREFVLQVVACRLEEQLLQWLLQSHWADAVEDIQTVVGDCKDPYFMGDGVELLIPMLDTLVTAAGVRAAACGRNAENRKERIAEAAEKLKMSSFTRSCCVLRSLKACEAKFDDADTWTKFLELPFHLQSRLFNSRNGRAFMDEAEQVIALQQAELAGECETTEGQKLDEEQTQTATALWNLVEQLVELVTARTNSGHDSPVALNDPNAITVTESVMDLEEYFKTKTLVDSHLSDLPLRDDINSLDYEDEKLSAIEQLSRICSLSKSELSLSSDLLEKVLAELSTVEDLNALSIHSSFLLSLQMRLSYCFVDYCNTVKGKFDQRVTRVFNRLEAEDFGHVAPLVSLAVFCPEKIIQQFIRGARTDVLHHNLYLEVLRASPLLLEWNQGAEDGTPTILLALQQALLDITENQDCYDRESQHIISFLSSLVGISCRTSQKQKPPVMKISTLIDNVFIPVCSAEGSISSISMQLNLYTLTQQLLEQFVKANAGDEVGATALKSFFDLALLSLCSSCPNDHRVGILIRERLLLLLKNVMELMSDPVAIVKLEQCQVLLSPSIWTLLGLFNNELGDDGCCKGMEDVMAIEALMQGKSGEELQASAPLPAVISAAQVLLWGLLWGSTLSEYASVEFNKAEIWRLVDAIAKYEFPVSKEAKQTVKGSLLIQSAIAEMMLECGGVLFKAMNTNIIPYLLEYEPIGPQSSPEETIRIPGWATSLLPAQPEMELQQPCRLVSTHLCMKYVAKCWSLSSAASLQLATPPSILVVESLSHVLTALEQSATSSKGTLAGTLFCFQWLCFLISASYEAHLDAVSAWSTVRTQLELLMLQLLHQLGELKEAHSGEATFSQYFVAAWLAYLPVGQLKQVSNFIASRTSN